jgi:hypothetical protein
MMFKKKISLIIVCVFIIGVIPSFPETGNYYQFKIDELKIISGKLPDYSKRPNRSKMDWRNRRMLIDYMQPYAVGKKGEEIYLILENKKSTDKIWTPYNVGGQFYSNLLVVVHSNSKSLTTGSLYLPRPDLSGMDHIRFQFPVQERAKRTSNEKEKHINRLHQDFVKAKRNYYKRLMRMEIPGAAWFRHQLTVASQKSKIKSGTPPRAVNSRRAVNRRGRQTGLERTYSLFSGGRALSENLQLDRQLRIPNKEDETIDISSLEGITTAEIDWAKEVEGKNPKKDVLASFVPMDQYAVFFPTFQAMLDLVDELDSRGTPVLQLMEPRSEDALTRQRYQRQLCLPTSQLSRIFGPALVKSVAFTGSDPYFRTGTDLAVLFETVNPGLLTTTVAMRHASALKKNADCKKVKGSIMGVSYSGVVSTDRNISSYMAVLKDKVVVVSNSKSQLKQVIEIVKGKGAALSTLGEYTFFRDRYRKNNKDEAAFLVLSDATIRKWCSPKWRIGDSRRTRAAAEMMETQAQQLSNIIKTNGKPISSGVYGSLDFLTPIVELDIGKVSQGEADAYKWFRKNHQNQWRQFFDPIAIRFTLSPSRIGVDITVMPLIAHTTYGSLMNISANSAITADSGDPHREALIHYIMSLDPNSEPVRSAANFMSRMAPQVVSSGLNWLGNWLAIYMDKDVFWKEMEDAKKAGGSRGAEKFMEKNFNRFPAALVLSVSNSLKLSLFLTSLRAFVEQTSPGLTTWESLKYKGIPYVRIKARERRSSNKDSGIEIFYTPTPDAFALTLSENVLKSMLDRSASAGNKKRTSQAGKHNPWLGKSICFTVRDPVLNVLRILYGNPMKTTFQRRAWGNIFILNEWRKRFNIKNPQEFHQKYWQTRLLCPGGGEYTWDKTFQTYQSSVFGHPGEPKELDVFNDPLYKIIEANLGITFESNGLRARGELRRRQ